MKVNRITTTVTMDDFGRIMIPKAIRKLFKSREFTMEADVKEKALTLKPVPTWDEMAGFIKHKIDLDDLVRDRETQWH